MTRTTAIVLAALAALPAMPGTAQATSPASCDAAVALPPRSTAKAARMTAPARRDSLLVALFDEGRPFPQFLAEAKARREGWLRNAENARVEEPLLARARAVGGTWRFLVIAIDACGDSMNSVPYLAKLAELVPGFDLRIVLPERGRAVQESHRSLDGRTATPTIVLLDAQGRDAGCIVELPRQLREWSRDLRLAGQVDSLHAGTRAFYEQDRGRSITAEAVELVESAARGQRSCDVGTPRQAPAPHDPAPR